MIDQANYAQLSSFGKRVAELRRRSNLTQQQLADKTGMSLVSIAYIETGKRWVRLTTLDKIAQALDVEMSELLRFN